MRKWGGVNNLASGQHFRRLALVRFRFRWTWQQPSSKKTHRVSRVAVMSAAAPGSSKAAHGDASAKKKKGPGALATAYLVIYNVVMTAGWAACFRLLMLLWCVRACVCVSAVGQNMTKHWWEDFIFLFVFMPALLHMFGAFFIYIKFACVDHWETC